MHISREKGFTLLELLAAIVLIGIIFTALFHFLGQGIFMSAGVEEQYITAQLAERELERIKMDPDQELPSEYGNENQVKDTDVIEHRGKDYHITVILKAENEQEFNAGLFRLKVKVEEEESSRSSVAYGWYTE